MNITVKCFATLFRKQPGNADAFPVEPGETVGSVVDRLDIPRDDVAIIFVNGVHAGLDAELRQGDRLGLFPAVGGG